MFAYVLLACAPIAYGGILLALKNTHRLKEMPYRNSILSLFFLLYYGMLLLRNHRVGIDTQRYLDVFKTAHLYSWAEWYEIRSSEFGFATLTKLLRHITSSEMVYLGLIAAAILLPIWWLYYHESKEPILTMMIFLILPLFSMFFSGFRQSIAIALTVPAYCYVRKREKFKFLLVVLFAMLFHRSAAIVLLLYPVYHMKEIKRKYIVLLAPLMILFYIYSDMLYFVFLGFAGDFYEERYNALNNTSAYAMLLLFVALLIFCILFRDESIEDEEIVGLRNILTLSVFLQCFSAVSQFAMRMNYYFLLFLPLLIPRVIWQSSGKNAFTCKFADYVLVSYFLYYFLNKAYAQESYFGIYPYLPIWKN